MTTGKAPYMRLWVSDFAGSVADMTAAQRGAHISMLCYAWERGCCPTDLRRLKRITGEIDDEDLSIVLQRWTLRDTPDGSHYFNERQERERGDVRMRHDKAVKAAGKRWLHAQKMPEPCSHDPTPLLEACPRDATHSLIVPESQSSDAHSLEAQRHNKPRRLRKQVVSARGVITFNFETATFSGISDETIKAWTEAYPAVDVNRTILRSAEWLLANPNKRKKTYNRFLTSWLSRSQERGGDRLPTHNTTTAVPEHLQF